jgi:O-antigen/teichoic acid export membrane protein
MNSLSRPGVSAVKWGLVSTLARLVLQLGAQVMLARTLGPEVFGVFAIGLLVLTLAGFLSGFGFSWSLLQRAELHENDIRFAWTWQVMAGALASCALYALAPWLASYFHEPRALGVIRWLAPACLLQAAAANATHLLQRDLNFRAIGMVQVGSYAVGYVAVGLPMALLGAGVNALVAAWLVQATLSLVASYALKPHAARPLFWYAGAATAMGTGQAVFFTNLVNWLLGNLDRLMIARLLNAQAMGLYNVACNLATLPNTMLLGALQPAFMAAGARLQTQLPRLGRVYLQMLGTLLVLGLPVFTALALLAPDLVRLLYGPRWEQAGPVLAILLACTPAYVMWGISTPVLWNTQRKNHEYALQLPLLLLGALAFYRWAGDGIVAAAALAGGLLLLRALTLVTAAFKALALPWHAALPDLLRGLLLSALGAAGVLGGQCLTSRFDQPLLSLAGGSLLALCLVAAPVALRPRWLGAATLTMLLRFMPRLEATLSKAAGRDVNTLDAQPS